MDRDEAFAELANATLPVEQLLPTLHDGEQVGIKVADGRAGFAMVSTQPNGES